VSVRVTENLYDAIMELRPTSGERTIWIDSICIDQTNDQEKSWQVELMGDIYKQATQVYAWLGRASCGSDQVIDYLNTFGAKAEACGIYGIEGPHLELW
jgi:Heterokaryon incompatibility protein (HET)